MNTPYFGVVCRWYLYWRIAYIRMLQGLYNVDVCVWVFWKIAFSVIIPQDTIHQFLDFCFGIFEKYTYHVLLHYKKLLDLAILFNLFHLSVISTLGFLCLTSRYMLWRYI